MSHARGYIPSSAAERARFKHVHHLLGSSSPTYPPAASTSQHAPPVMDQGQTSSCGGHGTAVGVATALAAKGTPLPFVPSPKGIYDDARAAGGESPLADNGIDPATLLTSLVANGVRAIQAPTSDGRYSDCDPATINTPETPEQNAAASQDVLVGEYMIDPRDPAFPGLTAACLARGVPVGVGIQAEPFESWNAGAPLGGTADYTQADHWVVVLDYYTDTNGNLIFKIRNSWSEGWGDAGCIEVTAGWLQSSCGEAIAFDVSLPAAPCTPQPDPTAMP